MRVRMIDIEQDRLKRLVDKIAEENSQIKRENEVLKKSVIGFQKDAEYWENVAKQALAENKE